jgi:beta-1,2-mannobiose phosphorylase / 1,2-beta-oligomannan phosphorylase
MNTAQAQKATAPELAHRFPENPLLSPRDIHPSTPGLQVECLLNPAAFRFEGRIWLLLRVAERPAQKEGVISFPVLDHGAIRIQEFSKNDPLLDNRDPRVINYDGEDYLTTLSHLRLVSSEDGVHFREEPDFPRLIGEGSHECFGIEDCRVSQIGSRYYLTYSSSSPNGVIVGMRSTENWSDFTHHGVLFPAHNKDCALFDEKVSGRYFALHRPSSPEIGGNYIWIAESEDLIHWGNHRCIARTRPGMWDSARVGAGAAPIRTERGWLEIYHGATAENRYCLGALLLDPDEPWKVLARSREPIMEPVAAYEKVGFFGNVVFTNGHVIDGDSLTVYYGASDSVICAARFSIRAILATL